MLYFPLQLTFLFCLIPSVSYCWPGLLFASGMENPNALFSFHCPKTLQYKCKEVNLKGQLLYSWPYRWEENIDLALAQRLGRDLENWITGVNSSFKIDKKKSEIIKDVAVGSIYYAPKDWIRNADSDDVAYTKLLVFFKTVWLVTILEDCTDINIQKDQIPETFYFALAKICFIIFSFELNSIKEMEALNEFIFINEVNPMAGKHLYLVFDYSVTLKQQFGANKDSVYYFALQFRYCFELGIWGGQPENPDAINLGRQHFCRILSGGFSPLQEILFVLDGIEIPKIIRENVYWKRCWDIAAFLPARTNDIISLEKELGEYEKYQIRPDNIIVIYMDIDNCTFEKALSRAIREHDDALTEFRDTYFHFEKYPNHLYELNDDMKEIFFNTLTRLAEFIACSLQGQVILKRYLKNLEYRIESVSSKAHPTLEKP